MLKAVFTEKDGVISLKIDGHAGYAEIGYDIICSSCSILAYTLAQIVGMAFANKKLMDKPLVQLESGKGIISCKPKTSGYFHIRESFKFAEVGFILLAHDYPQYVDITMFGMDENPSK
jgi:uncharacterized protein YsxB (DUF464 family)